MTDYNTIIHVDVVVVVEGGLRRDKETTIGLK